MYMNVKGNILNGISVPSYSAKSMPDMKEGAYDNEYNPDSVSTQESNPLPVLTGRDTIYVLIDTDNDYSTGYSSLGTSIGAEKMVEINGVHGIITLRVIKEWTGTNTNDWSWSQGEIIDAAASGGELELEVVKGDYWIHIVSWNGEEESSSDFKLESDAGRYADMGASCIVYYKFNGNYNDSCTTDTTNLSPGHGSVNVTAAGKMGNGLTLNGFQGYAQSSNDGSFDIRSDWSVEAWIKPSSITNERTILFIGDGDGTEEANELSIHLTNGGNIAACDGLATLCSETSLGLNPLEVNKWYHIAVTHDGTADNIDIHVNNVRVTQNSPEPNFNAVPSNADIIIGQGDDNRGDLFFEGVIDEVRIVDYQAMAFAGGLMISKVAGEFTGAGVITIYNSADHGIDLDGIKLMKNSVFEQECAALPSVSLASGGTTTATCDTLNAVAFYKRATFWQMRRERRGANESVHFCFGIEHPQFIACGTSTG